MFCRGLPRRPSGGPGVRRHSPQAVTFREATDYSVADRAAHAAAGEERTLPAGTIELPPGAVVPVADGIDAQPGEEWARPVDSSGDSSPVFVYSLLLATFL